MVAALDAVFGGLRAFLDGIFDDKVFVVSFISNVLVAALIVYLGDQLGVGSQLSTGVVVVLGIRIFTNMAAIRRHIFQGLRSRLEREKSRHSFVRRTRCGRGSGPGSSRPAARRSSRSCSAWSASRPSSRSG